MSILASKITPISFSVPVLELDHYNIIDSHYQFVIENGSWRPVPIVVLA